MSVTKFGDIPAFDDHWLDKQKGLCPMNEASVMEALYPLHIVEIDHFELDMNVADSYTGLLLGRPWVTLGIDAYSRAVWSMYVSLEPPSAITVSKTILQGILPKRVKEKYGTYNEWDISGIPDVISVGGGAEFRNTEIVKTVTEALESSIRFCPVRAQRYGSIVKSMFGTLTADLRYSLININPGTPITLERVSMALIRYVTDIYHMKSHRDLPNDCDTPILRFRQGITQVGFPRIVPEEMENTLTIGFLPKTMKTYRSEGIRHNHVLYRHEGCTHLEHAQGAKCEVRYDPYDISKVYVLQPGTHEYIEMPTVMPPVSSSKP